MGYELLILKYNILKDWSFVNPYSSGRNKLEWIPEVITYNLQGNCLIIYIYVYIFFLTIKCHRVYEE